MRERSKIIIDSDGEEFADTIDSSENATNVNIKETSIKAIGSLQSLNNQKIASSNKSLPNGTIPNGCIPECLKKSNCDSDVIRAIGKKLDEDDINQHLNKIVNELQQSINTLSNRVDKLENKNKKSTKWWPIELSPLTVGFLILYPIAVNLIMDKYQKRKS